MAGRLLVSTALAFCARRASSTCSSTLVGGVQHDVPERRPRGDRLPRALRAAADSRSRRASTSSSSASATTSRRASPSCAGASRTCSRSTRWSQTSHRGLERSRRVTTCAHLSARSGRQRLRPRRARSGADGRRKRIEALAHRGPLLDRLERSRRSRSRSSRARPNATRRRARSLTAAATLGPLESVGRPRRPRRRASELVGAHLRRRRPRARRVHARGDRAARDRRGADRRRDRQQPHLLAHEGARSPRGARLDGRRPRARGEEPARRDQGRRAAPRGGRHGARDGGPAASNEFLGIILEEVESPRSRRRELPRLRAPARRQPDPARRQRRRPPHRADPLEPASATASSTSSSSSANRCRARSIDPGAAPPGPHEPGAERDPGDGRRTARSP